MASGDQSQFKKSEVPPSVPMSDKGEPLRTGVPYYSDETKRQLSIVGWKEGDPLPPNFGEALASLRDEVAADTAKAYTELPSKMAGYVPPKQKIVDIESLPPEKQEDIRKWLSGYRDDMAVMSAPQPHLQPQPQPTPQPQPLPQPQPEPEPQQEADTPPIVAANEVHTHCARCLWPASTPFTVVASDQDKQQFLISILSGKDYQRQYELFGDSVRLRVRSLTVDEVSMINIQLGYMVRAGLIAGNLEYTNYNMLYRTALGTTELKGGVHILYQGTPIETFNKTNQLVGENPTTLPQYAEIFAKALRSEVVVQIVNKTYREFQRLVELLEEMTNSPDFWKGIDLQDS